MLKSNWQKHHFENFNVSLGMSNSMDNQELYEQLLLRFIDTSIELETRLELAKNTADMRDARICAHSLKGLAANIGAKELQESAKKLEKDFANAPSTWPDNLQKQCLELAQLTRAELLPFVQKDKGATCSVVEKNNLLKKLEKQLEQSDPDACEIARRLFACQSDSLEIKRYHRVLDKVLHYEFDKALELMEQIRRGEMDQGKEEKRRFKVLVIDDMADSIALISNILKDDYDILVANNGAKGLQLATQTSGIDLILLDIVMLNIDGYTVCEHLKAQEKTRNIPIIFLTVLDEITDIEKGFALGGVDYVTKPFEPSILKARVKTHCELSAQRLKLEEFSDSLEAMVAKRTQELESAQLHAERLARQAQLGDVISMIAHQWKQPLSIISMIANGVVMDYDLNNLAEDNIKRDMQNITKQTTYLSTTIDDFRSFFNPKGEKQQLFLDSFCKTLQTLISPVLKHHAILFSILIEAHEINTYKNELLQVLINFISNAKDAILARNIVDGKIVLQIKQENNQMIFEVSDNGGGINKKLFSTLDEAYVSTKDSSDEGGGLGLYMSQMIAKKHLGGEISWQNLDKGAKFTLVIPFI